MVLAPGEVRVYPWAATRFQAAVRRPSRYSIPVVARAAHQAWPHAHRYDLFFVLEGTMSVLLDTEWSRGTRAFVLIPSRPPRLRERGCAAPGVPQFLRSGASRSHPEIAIGFFEPPSSGDQGTIGDLPPFSDDAAPVNTLSR